MYPSLVEDSPSPRPPRGEPPVLHLRGATSEGVAFCIFSLAPVLAPHPAPRLKCVCLATYRRWAPPCGRRAFRTHRWSSDVSFGATGTLGSTEAPPAHRLFRGVYSAFAGAASRSDVPAHLAAWRRTRERAEILREVLGLTNCLPSNVLSAFSLQWSSLPSR